jgi:hypothetical protein
VVDLERILLIVDGTVDGPQGHHHWPGGPVALKEASVIPHRPAAVERVILATVTGPEHPRQHARNQREQPR